MNLAEAIFSNSYIPFSENRVKNHILLDNHRNVPYVTSADANHGYYTKLLLMPFIVGVDGLEPPTLLVSQAALNQLS